MCFNVMILEIILLSEKISLVALTVVKRVKVVLRGVMCEGRGLSESQLI